MLQDILLSVFMCTNKMRGDVSPGSEFLEHTVNSARQRDTPSRPETFTV